MPFGFFKKIFKKHGSAAADKYLGEGAGDIVEGAIDQINVGDNEAGGAGGLDVGSLLGAFTGKQANGLQSLFGMLGGSSGGVEQHAASKGLDPSLISSVVGMLSSSGGGAGGGGGFNLGSLVQVAQSLTQGGQGGQGGIGGFMQLLSGSGGSGSSSNIIGVLVGMAKSFFAMQMGKNTALQDWGKAGADKNKDDGNIASWGGHLVKDLIFPGKKEKDIVDEDPADKPTPGDNKIKDWFDGHPEIGKMQKDIFDDIFDTTDDDEDARKDDPAPLIPTPNGFEDDCSILDNASILFLNTNILLELRKDWRFLYSTQTMDKDFNALVDKLLYAGPTLIIIRSTNGEVFGAFTSSSWCETEGGWTGNGDTFVFSIKPKMAVFYSTGKDEHFMYLSRDEGIGLGGRVGHFGLSVDPSMASGSYHEEVDTFDLPAISGLEGFEIDHLEAWGLGPEVDKQAEKENTKVRKPNLQTRNNPVDMDDLLGQIG